MSEAPQEEETAWEDFEPGEYSKVASELVHFSFKTVNSNATKGGIRLSDDKTLNLPYVALRRLMRNRQFAVDYTSTGTKGKTAKITKQIRMLRRGESPCAPEERIALLASIDEAGQGSYIEGIDELDPRLRQLLIPKGDTYVVLTPLCAGGLLAEIKADVTARNNATKIEAKVAGADSARAWLRTAHIGVGGANPHNVGALVRDMQTPLVFEAPQQKHAERTTLAIHHRGFKLTPPHFLMDEYFQCQKESGKTNLAARARETMLAQRIAQAILARAAEAQRTLENNRNILPRGEDGNVAWLSPAVHPLLRAAILPQERSSQWPVLFAKHIAENVLAYRNSAGEQLPYSDRDMSRLCSDIEEALR